MFLSRVSKTLRHHVHHYFRVTHHLQRSIPIISHKSHHPSKHLTYPLPRFYNTSSPPLFSYTSSPTTSSGTPPPSLNSSSPTTISSDPSPTLSLYTSSPTISSGTPPPSFNSSSSTTISSGPTSTHPDTTSIPDLPFLVDSTVPDKFVGVETTGSLFEHAYEGFISYNTLKSGDLRFYEIVFTYVQFGFEWVQFYTGVPWWGAIIFISAILRLTMIPIQIKQIKASAKMQELSKVVEVYNEKATKLQQQKKLTVTEHMAGLNAVYRKNGINQLSTMKYLAIQLPIYILLFVSLRNICLRPEWHDELANGGILWFVDLTVLDPFYILPILNGITMFGMVEMQNQVSGVPSGVMMRWFVVGMSIFIVVISSRFPMGVNLYWVSSTVFAIAVLSLFKIDKFRLLMGMKPKKEVVNYLIIPPPPAQILNFDKKKLTEISWKNDKKKKYYKK